MEYRNARLADIPSIMEIIGQAQAYMSQLGIDQWNNGYPNAAIFEQDIAKDSCYLFYEKSAPEIIAGLITVQFGGEPAYDKIEGCWLSKQPFGVIHRTALAASKRGSGLANELILLAQRLTVAHGLGSLRVDTHEDNLTMRRLLERNGFTGCGIVHYEGPGFSLRRIGYEKLL